MPHPMPSSTRRRSKVIDLLQLSLLPLFEAAERLRQPAPPAELPHGRLDPVGRWFNLLELRDEINQSYFAGRLEVAITWGRGRPVSRRRRRRSRRTIQLGSYMASQNLVRIHPALDRPDVPRYVVAAIVHHEMLHAAVPPVERAGRRAVHTPEFRHRERQFEHHAAAESWIRQHVLRLIEGRSG